LIKKPIDRKLTVFDGWALGAGVMIGATIFVASGYMSGIAGPAAALSFVLAAFVTMIIAVCYCELSSAFPRSGGAYIYPKETIKGRPGIIISFVTGWAFYGGQGLGSAVVALTCAFYINWTLELVGVINPIPDNIFAMLIIVFFAISNIIDSKFGRLIQSVSTFIVVGALTLFIVLGGVNVDPVLLTPFAPYGFSAVVAAGAIGWAAFGGWSAIPNMSSEFRDPARDVPRSMLLSVAFCSVLFAVVVVVMNGLMPYTQLAVENAPLAAAAATFTRYGAIIIAFGGIFASATTLNGLMMAGSHMLASMGREGSLPHILSKKNERNGTPRIALFTTSIGMLLLASTGLALIILQMVAFVTAFSWIVACLCVYALRINRKDVTSLYRTPLYPVTPIVAVLLALIMMSRMSPIAIMVGCIWIAVGFVLFVLFAHTPLKNLCHNDQQQ